MAADLEDVTVDLSVGTTSLMESIGAVKRALHTFAISASDAFAAGYLIENRRGRNRLVKVWRGVRR